MNFLFVEQILDVLNLQNPSLEVLVPDTNNYQAILYQHKGVFVPRADHFGNDFATDADNQFMSVVDLALQTNVSLFLSPEYSCPWSAIRRVLDAPDKQPNVGKLWVLGCESITPFEIRALKTRYEANPEVIVYFDENALNGNGTFLDPLCYIFKTTKQTGEPVAVCLVQFKTQHMGVRSTRIERDNYIPGQELYIFRNSPGSIYLFTLICSEALAFAPSAEFMVLVGERWTQHPYIILHPQLNPSPNHQDFRIFRKTVLQSARKEIIALNWAQGSQITLADKILPLEEFPGSAFFTDVDGLDFSNEDHFQANHEKGLYYTFLKPSFHIFHLNGSKEIFHVQNTKPSQGGGAMVLQRRTGPRVLQCYDLLQDFSVRQAANIDDGLLSFLKLVQSPNQALGGIALTPMQKERLTCLSAGEVEHKDGLPWHRADRVRLCNLDEDGVIRRMTFTQDTNGHKSRTDYLDKIDRLNQIIGIPDQLPVTVSFLRQNFTGVMFYNDGTKFHYNFNLVATDKLNKATGSFCGRLDKSAATKKFDNLKRLFTDSDQQRKRIVVWYEPTLGTIDSIFDSSRPSITDDYSLDPSSIVKQ